MDFINGTFLNFKIHVFSVNITPCIRVHVLSASNLSKIRIRIASPEAEVNKGDNFEMENLVNNIKQTVQDYK